MYSVSAAGYRDVASRIDEQPSRFPVPRSWRRILADNTERCASKSFEVTCGKIFLPQLNEINPATSCLCDLRQHSALAVAGVTRQLDAICNVEDEQAFTD